MLKFYIDSDITNWMPSYNRSTVMGIFWSYDTPDHYISQLVRALWLVNSVGRILLYGLLKFEQFFVAKLFRDLSPSVLNFYSK